MTENRFDFLRLAFATVVFVFHLILLAYNPSPFTDHLWAGFALLAVQGFFVISGALVYGSLQRSTSVASFVEKRVRRVYPAYLVVILLPAIFALVTTGAFSDVARYLAANLLFLNFLVPDLPGMFAEQVEPTVNGSLWTIKIEVIFYMILPLLGWVLSKSGKNVIYVMAAIYIGAEAWRTAFEWMAFAPGIDDTPYSNLCLQLSRQLPGQMSFFISGIALWKHRELIRRRWSDALALGACLLVISFSEFFELFRAAGMALLVGAVAFAPGAKLSPAKYGDLSYGVYISHFPIIQMLVAVGLFERSLAIGTLVCIALVFMASVLLWRYVERPMLSKTSQYRSHGSPSDAVDEKRSYKNGGISKSAI